MMQMQDYELLKSQDGSAPLEPPPGPSRVWIVVAVMILGAAAAVVFFVVGRPAATVTSDAAKPAPRAAPARPLGAETPAIALPPLDETDPVIRDLVKQVTSHPRIAAWLATSGLIRSFTAGVQNIAEGATPAARFAVLRPASPFETAGAGTLRIAPRSYQRYDDLAAAAASIDAAGAARLYTTVKPRIDDAYRDLGFPEAPFDAALERALVSLLQTPAAEGTVRNDGTGIGYRYTDPALEGLTPAQKQLLRTGPANVRTIQASLRKIALALGIPADRLPPPRP